MKSRLLAAATLALLSGCTTTPDSGAAPPAPVAVKIIAFNDFHGNLEPPKMGIDVPAQGPGATRVPAGGAAYLASAIEAARADNPHHVVVSAGDMIGASPLLSSLFLDEPTIAAMNLIRVDFNAVGNHEFDRGRAELVRLQKGGCEKNTAREPCQVDPAFPGASFGFLAANVVTEGGGTLFPAYGMRSFGSGAGAVKLGFIGMTLKGTPTIVTPSGVAGLTFQDEADTANALVPKLRAEGADAVVLVIHQGATSTGGYNDKSCEGLAGELLPILDRLDPGIDVVVSGHTHRAYVCDYGKINPARPFLLTSAGQYGTMLTDIDLSIDPVAGRVISKRADNRIVQSEAYRDVALSDAVPRFTPDPRVATLIETYVAKAAPLASRVVGRLSGPALRAQAPSREQVLGNLIADAQLAATRSNGAQVAFMNPGGVRTDLEPNARGEITYGQLFAAQPFGNSLVTKSFTGCQLKALLEQQFGDTHSAERPLVLLPSSTLRYGYDLSRPEGQRILDVRLDGQPLRDETVYRVTMSNFLSTGGDNFTAFMAGTDPVGGPLDVDALEAYLSSTGPLMPPATDRLRDLTPR